MSCPYEGKLIEGDEDQAFGLVVKDVKSMQTSLLNEKESEKESFSHKSTRISSLDKAKYPAIYNKVRRLLHKNTSPVFFERTNIDHEIYTTA
jgi:hypothetical protein